MGSSSEIPAVLEATEEIHASITQHVYQATGETPARIEHIEVTPAPRAVTAWFNKPSSTQIAAEIIAPSEKTTDEPAEMETESLIFENIVGTRNDNLVDTRNDKMAGTDSDNVADANNDNVVGAGNDNVVGTGNDNVVDTGACNLMEARNDNVIGATTDSSDQSNNGSKVSNIRRASPFSCHGGTTTPVYRMISPACSVKLGSQVPIPLYPSGQRETATYVPLQHTLGLLGRHLLQSDPERPRFVKLIPGPQLSSPSCASSPNHQVHSTERTILGAGYPGWHQRPQVVYPPIEIFDDGNRQVVRAPRRVPHQIIDVKTAEEHEYKLAEYNSSLLYLNHDLQGTEAYRRLPFLKNARDVVPFLPKGTPLPNVYKHAVYHQDGSPAHLTDTAHSMSEQSRALTDIASGYSRLSGVPSRDDQARSWFLACCSGPRVESIQGEECSMDYETDSQIVANGRLASSLT